MKDRLGQISDYGDYYWEKKPEFDINLVADKIVENEIAKMATDVLLRAERKMDHIDVGCYCPNCLRRIAYAANDMTFWIMRINPEEPISPAQWNKISKFLYFVVSDKRGMKIIRGTEPEKLEAQNWIVQRANGLSDVGNIS